MTLYSIVGGTGLKRDAMKTTGTVITKLDLRTQIVMFFGAQEEVMKVLISTKAMNMTAG